MIHQYLRVIPHQHGNQRPECRRRAQICDYHSRHLDLLVFWPNRVGLGAAHPGYGVANGHHHSHADEGSNRATENFVRCMQKSAARPAIVAGRWAVGSGTSASRWRCRSADHGRRRKSATARIAMTISSNGERWPTTTMMPAATANAATRTIVRAIASHRRRRKGSGASIQHSIPHRAHEKPGPRAFARLLAPGGRPVMIDGSAPMSGRPRREREAR